MSLCSIAMSDIGNWLQECTTIKFEQLFFINPFVRNMYKTIADTPCVLEIIYNSTDTFQGFLIAVNTHVQLQNPIQQYNAV